MCGMPSPAQRAKQHQNPLAVLWPISNVASIRVPQSQAVHVSLCPLPLLSTCAGSQLALCTRILWRLALTNKAYVSYAVNGVCAITSVGIDVHNPLFQRSHQCLVIPLVWSKCSRLQCCMHTPFHCQFLSTTVVLLVGFAP